MRKLMLVIDEYRELVALETFFRRLGFDVLSIGKDLLFDDALVRFHPDLVMATYKGRMVDGLKISSKLKSLIPAPRMVLVVHNGGSYSISKDQERWLDGIVEFPTPADKLIAIVSRLLGLDEQPLLAKYRKQATVKNQVETSIFVQEEEASGTKSQRVNEKPVAPAAEAWTPETQRGRASEVRTARSDGYSKFLEQNAADDVSHVLPQKQAHLAMQALKTASESERANLDRLDQEKRAFAQALFTDEQKKK